MTEGRGSGAARRAAAVVGVVALVGAVAAGAFWAGRTTLSPPRSIEQAPDSFVEVPVVDREIGRVLTLSTTARRENAPLAVNALVGVVTQVAADGTFDAGDVLYRVGATPVVLVAGDTPFWRDLGQGASGEDVAQVQRLLVAAGSRLTVDGTWRASTTAAVKAWQKARGFEPTGAFVLGELVASPTVPVALDLDEKVLRPGAVLAGGEDAVLVPSGEPRFVMELTPGQAGLVPAGTGVTVHGSGVDWTGVTGEPVQTETGSEVAVTAADGSVLCGSQCGSLPASGETYLLTDVAVRPPVTGPVVPLAAVATGPDGGTSVTVVGPDGDARAVPVTIVAVADGLAVVQGVVACDVVRVFAERASGGAPGAGGSPSPAPSSSAGS